MSTIALHMPQREQLLRHSKDRRAIRNDRTGSNIVTDWIASSASSDDMPVTETPNAALMAHRLKAIAEKSDRAAFAEIFSHYAPRVKAFLRHRRIDDQLSEEITQEVMLTIWRKAALFDPNKALPSTWIFTIARNRLIDTLRRDRQRDMDLQDPSLSPETPLPADHTLESRQIGERVREAIERLPEEQASILRLSYVEGLAHGAISERLGIPLGTVKSRLRLAFARLRPILEDLR